MGSWIEWEIKIEGKRSREENILDSKMRERRGVEGGISKWADLGSGLSLAGGRLTSSCPCPLSTLELMWWNLVERNLWNSLEEKKKNYWWVWGCERLREHGQLWGWGKWGELTGDGRFIDSVFHEAWVFLAPIASITTSTCCLLEPWPSSSMGGLSHPAAEPSPEEPVA